MTKEAGDHMPSHAPPIVGHVVVCLQTTLTIILSDTPTCFE